MKKALLLFVLFCSLFAEGQSKVVGVKVAKRGTTTPVTPPVNPADDYITVGTNATNSFFSLTKPAYVGYAVTDTITKKVYRIYNSVSYPAGGPYQLTWDGQSMDTVNITGLPNLGFEVVADTMKVEWEGVALSVSTQKENTVWGNQTKHNGYNAAAIDLIEHPTSGWVYYITGYSEGNVTLRRFHLDSVGVGLYMQLEANKKYAELGGPMGGFGSIYSFDSDGDYIYTPAMTFHAQGANHQDDNAAWIMAWHIDPASARYNRLKLFTNGVAINPGGQMNFENAIKIRTGIGSSVGRYMALGTAVDNNYIYTAFPNSTDTIFRVHNKVSGDLVSIVMAGGNLVNPRRMRSDGTNIWLMHGNPQVIGKFQVTNGVLNTTPLLNITSVGDPQSLSIATSGGVKYVYVTDGTDHVVKRFRTDNGNIDNTYNSNQGYYGQLGGYSQTAVVSNNRFYFDRFQDKVAGLHVKDDGTTWLADAGNNRMLRTNSSFSLTHKVEFQGASYSLFQFGKDSSKLLVQSRLYQIDYNQPIQTGWQLIRQYGPTLSKRLQQTARSNAAAVWFEWVQEFPNGKVYAAAADTSVPDRYVHVYQFTDSGARFTDSFLVRNFIADNFRIWPDNSAIRSDNRYENGYRLMYTYPLTGYRNDTWKGATYQSPVWSGTATLRASVRHDSTISGGLNGFIPGTTDMLMFSTSRPNGTSDKENRRWHLGTVPIGIQQEYRMRAAHAISSANGSSYPSDGRFEIANGVNYPASAARAAGNLINWQYNGENWNGGQANMHHLLYKNGVQLRQFGVAVGSATAALPKGYPGYGPNTKTLTSTIIGDNLKIWQGEEGMHGGLLRWNAGPITSIRAKIIAAKQFSPN